MQDTFQEKDCYRIVSVGELSFDGNLYCGRQALSRQLQNGLLLWFWIWLNYGLRLAEAFQEENKI